MLVHLFACFYDEHSVWYVTRWSALERDYLDNEETGVWSAPWNRPRLNRFAAEAIECLLHTLNDGQALGVCLNVSSCNILACTCV